MTNIDLVKVLGFMVVFAVTFAIGYAIGAHTDKKVKKPNYDPLFEDFDLGLDTKDYRKCKKAYDTLMRVLPIQDPNRRALAMQIRQFPSARK